MAAGSATPLFNYPECQEKFSPSKTTLTRSMVLPFIEGFPNLQAVE